MNITKEQARKLCEAHDIDELLLNEEEVECLETHNPDLLDAYIAIQKVANGIEND